MACVAFDATFLTLLFHPSATPPADRKTGKPVERAHERVQHLIATLERDKASVVSNK